MNTTIIVFVVLLVIVLWIQFSNTESIGPQVSISGMRFVPNEITIQREQTVVWTNNDAPPHTVASGQPGIPDGLFDSGLLSKGEKFSYQFNKPGIYAYYCTLHPWMTGKVIVN